MTTGFIARVDERGRIIIPSSFRETLAIKEGSNVLLRVDDKNGMLMIIPFATELDELAKIEITMSDSPGTLHRILEILSSERIDLVRSESTAQERGRSAEWNAVVDLSNCKKKISQIRKKIMKEKVAHDVKIQKL